LSIVAAKKIEKSDHNLDRDLGEAWKSAGDLSGHEPELDESAGLFFWFTAIAFAVISALLLLVLYLVYPRLAQFHPLLPKGFACLVFALVALFALILFLIYLTVTTGRNLLPPVLGNVLADHQTKATRPGVADHLTDAFHQCRPRLAEPAQRRV